MPHCASNAKKEFIGDELRLPAKCDARLTIAPGYLLSHRLIRAFSQTPMNTPEPFPSPFLDRYQDTPLKQTKHDSLQRSRATANYCLPHVQNKTEGCHHRQYQTFVRWGFPIDASQTCQSNQFIPAIGIIPAILGSPKPLRIAD